MKMEKKGSYCRRHTWRKNNRKQKDKRTRKTIKTISEAVFCCDVTRVFYTKKEPKKVPCLPQIQIEI